MEDTGSLSPLVWLGEGWKKGDLGLGQVGKKGYWVGTGGGGKGIRARVRSAGGASFTWQKRTDGEGGA